MFEFLMPALMFLMLLVGSVVIIGAFVAVLASAFDWCHKHEKSCFGA